MTFKSHISAIICVLFVPSGGYVRKQQSLSQHNIQHNTSLQLQVCRQSPANANYFKSVSCTIKGQESEMRSGREDKDRRRWRRGGCRAVGNKVERGVNVNKWPSFPFTPSDGYLS